VNFVVEQPANGNHQKLFQRPTNMNLHRRASMCPLNLKDNAGTIPFALP
jgi:hypothetical protein